MVENDMLEKIVIGLVVFAAAIYLLRRSLKKGSGCGCSSGGCDSGSGGCCGSGGASQRKPLDISSCACPRKDG